MTTYSSDAAVAGTGVDVAVPWHFGDPFGEQRQMSTGAVVIDRSHRDVLAVPGEDRLGWLHSICSQHLQLLVDGDATQALVLSPNGHAEQHWQVAELDGTVWIDTEPGAAATVLGYLEKMRFLKRVEPADVSSAWAVLTLAGPDAAAVLGRAGLGTLPEAARARTLPGGGFVRRMPGLGADGAITTLDLLVPRDRLAHVRGELVAAGATPAGLWAFEAMRVEARIPRLGFETDHRTIPHEVGWIGTAVHLDKGCYRGQETVARVQNLGRPPRRLALVHYAGESDELPAAGTPVESGGRAVGFAGTAVHHWELGPVGLAVVKRSLADDTELHIARHAVKLD